MSIRVWDYKISGNKWTVTSQKAYNKRASGSIQKNARK